VNDGELSSSQRGQQIDLLLHDEIVSSPLEVLVRLLLDGDDDVSWLQSWRLIRLSLEGDLLAGLHSLVDVDLKDLPLRRDLLPVADLASTFGIDLLSGSLALVTRLLDLRVGRRGRKGKGKEDESQLELLLPPSSLSLPPSTTTPPNLPSSSSHLDPARERRKKGSPAASWVPTAST